MQCVATAPLVVTDRGGTTASRSRNCEGSEPLTRPNRGASRTGPCGFFLSVLPLGLECVRTHKWIVWGQKTKTSENHALENPGSRFLRGKCRGHSGGRKAYLGLKPEDEGFSINALLKFCVLLSFPMQSTRPQPEKSCR